MSMIQSKPRESTSPRSIVVLVCALVLASIVIRQKVFGQQPPLSQSDPRSLRQLKPPSAKFSLGPVIPGLRQKAVPQGIAYENENQRIIISHYFDNGPSCLSVLNRSTGKMVSSVTLKEASGELHRGHVGGTAVVKDALLIASDGYVLQYELGPILSRNPPASIAAVAKWKCETTASFCTATKDRLFVGEFAYGKDYPTDIAHHLKDRKGVRKYAWVCGYDATHPSGPPSCVLSVRQRVQGMCVTDDRIFLSISYGRRNRSAIVIYRNPLQYASHSTVKVRSGERVPLWFLDGENYIGEIDFPPMSEGIVMLGDQLAVLSESGAGKFQFGGKGPLDRILLLDVSKLK